MKAQTKTTLLNIFGSMFSNARAVECGKTLPWWSALIVFILGVFLPLIPSMVSIATSSGSAFLNNLTYGYDVQLVGSSIGVYLDGYEFEIDEEHRLSATTLNGSEYQPSAEQDVTPIFKYINTETNQVDFEIYYSVRSTRGSSTLDDLLDTIEETLYIEGTNTIYEEEENTSSSSSSSEEVVLYRPSFMIYYPDGLYSAIVRPNSSTIYASTGGDWKHHEPTKNFLKDMLSVDGKEPTVDNEESLRKDSVYIESVYDNWKHTFNLIYLTGKNNSLLINSLVFEAIYVALSFFMGLMIFLLTRGKRNYYRYLSFIKCQNINAWASFMPGLLAMILGFMIPQYAVMFFIILLGLRTMWLSMRQLRPQY